MEEAPVIMCPHQIGREPCWQELLVSPTAKHSQYGYAANASHIYTISFNGDASQRQGGEHMWV